MTKRIILCADDYGQNEPISQAIITLIEKKRLSATSCLTTFPGWLKFAKFLQPYTYIDVGLHFNLTEGDPGHVVSFPQLLKKAYLRQLDKRVILAEFNRQLDLFTQGMGRLPDYIDGHQHVHQLPVIRDVLIDIYQQRFRLKKCYIRSAYNPKAFYRFTRDGYIKNSIIQLCGAYRLKKQLIKYKIAHNSSFSGSYNFSHSKNYPAIFPQFLREVRHGGLIMCHPGLQSFTEQDSLAFSRPDEYNYLMSDDFLKDCKKEEIIIERF
jgi:hypothetical protein